MLLSEEELSLKKALEIDHGMETASQKASKFHTFVELKVSDEIMSIPSAKTLHVLQVQQNRPLSR